LTRPVSLDPELNVRVYAAGTPASMRTGGSTHPDLGSRTVVLDGIGPEEHTELTRQAALAGMRFQWSFPWLRLGGTSDQLLDLSGTLHRGTLGRVGAELRAAVTAFDAQLLRPSPTLVMGILNLTPDSFSDGGQWLDPGRAVAHALQMIADGADVIDIGGESTRPGAAEVGESEELRRVLPVIQRLRRETSVLLSIDTKKSGVARAAVAAGADWVNDVSGLTADPAIADVVAAAPNVRLVLMHMRMRPASERYSTSYAPDTAPAYEDVVGDTLRWLRVQADRAIESGVGADRLWIDPGFGFGKTFEQNVELLRRLREYTSAGLPVLIGTSRKSSIGKLLGDLSPEDRLEGTAATVALAIAQGVSAVRVHDVKPMARIRCVADALR
jgi:dihydropteroate synthase